MLVRCLYASRAVKPLTQHTVDTILDQSRRNNPKRGITGMLVMSDEVFIQVLEGGRDAVCDLYNTIVQDTRHTGVRLLMFDEITERRFGHWTMGHVNTAKVNGSLLLKYSEKATLNPFDAPGAATMALLNELVATAAIVNRN